MYKGLLVITLLCLSIASFASFTNAQSIVKTVRIEFSGGHCTLCDSDTGSYACSNGLGNWRNGTKYFINPLGDNENYHLAELNATVFGIWGCKASELQRSEIELLVQGDSLGFDSKRGSCLCNICNEPMFFSKRGRNKFPNYNHGLSANELVLNMINGLSCISEIVLDFKFNPGAPNGGSPDDPCDKFGGCGDHGECGFDQYIMDYRCMCDSEWFGPQCDCNVPSYHLETDNPPVLDVDESGFKTKDLLSLVVNVSAKYYDTTFHFKGSTQNTCNFPNPSNGIIWTREFDPDNCRYTYTGVLSWSSAYPDCFFKTEVVGDFTIVSGEIIVTKREDLGPLSDTRPGSLVRTIVSTLPFQLRFPNFVTFSQIKPKDITVFAKIEVFAAIIEQVFESVIPYPGTGTIKLLTSVQHPFQLTSPMSIEGPSGFALTMAGPTGNGGSDCLDNGSKCRQTWTITNQPSIRKCNLNGNYNSTFRIKCKPSQNHDCPIDEDTDTATVLFKLESSDFCPDLVDETDVFGFISSFKDPDHTIFKMSFLFDQTAYFKITVDSTKTTVTGTKIRTLKVKLWDGSTVVLYRYGNTAAGNALSLTVDDNKVSDESHFSVVINPAIFDVPADGNEKVTFFADLEVDFLSVGNKRFTLRGVVDSSSKSFSTESEVIVSSNSRIEPENPEEPEDDGDLPSESSALNLQPVFVLF